VGTVNVRIPAAGLESPAYRRFIAYLPLKEEGWEGEGGFYRDSHGWVGKPSLSMFCTSNLKIKR